MGNHRHPYNHIQKYCQTKQQGLAILFILNKEYAFWVSVSTLKSNKLCIYVFQSELSWKLHMNNKTPLSVSLCMLYQCLCGDMFAVAAAHIFKIFGEYSLFWECLANFHLLTACHVDIFIVLSLQKSRNNKIMLQSQTILQHFYKQLI